MEWLFDNSNSSKTHYNTVFACIRHCLRLFMDKSKFESSYKFVFSLCLDVQTSVTSAQNVTILCRKKYDF